jgi:3-oxoacyl-[acyl-carrier-protein] synthase III
MGIRVQGIGACVPTKVVTNHDLARTLDTSHEWIVEHTGIRERRLAPAEESPSDMGCRAALRCLEDAGVDGMAIDLIVVACGTPDQSQPAVACLIQNKLGVAERHCPAFDVNSVCSGFVFALDVAQSMMIANPEQFENVLVIGTDAFSNILNWDDRRTCIFFGDGAGAVLLARTEVDDGHRIHFQLGSDGRAAATSRCRRAGRACRQHPDHLAAGCRAGAPEARLAGHAVWVRRRPVVGSGPARVVATPSRGRQASTESNVQER